MTTKDEIEAIINRMPYSQPFLFVNKITYIDKEKIEGEFTYDINSFFYKGHFKNKPVTPGVILLETFAQYGAIAHGIFLLGLHKNDNLFTPVFTNTVCDFINPVYPNEKVKVVSNKVTLRRNFMKIKGYILNDKDEIVIQATGMCKYIMQ
jgi:3-hydroxyacyl-[acyl-carrier-protein] dehydratase